ncbi:glycoside hydrolase family 95 protein [Pedobacter heparinus]|uniref:Alpha-L-fucosidase n=1 Tax=Pedobacter heparinus (strain ATCC 13125 / DSM 2366 / CIP 104194 / JCM 7457 / NBRC 12017 / NCIMB 9290 / NRRL B-14731 / HIM 762-3) TaxID=485917 RepID=C6Y242_PEDHD|nr:glycoside hydrolase family 95 protein [Pedobacter heparinus]ACU03035.1 Alpha-L-fucosidase [Pedobacter heparinus DSM 2366]
MINRIHLIITAITLFVGIENPASAQSDHLLWYNKPAQFFEETMVLGNGKLGAAVFGGIKSDKIFLNDATLWSGEPVNPYMNPEAYKQIPSIREALKNENYKLANELNRKVQGAFSQSYAPLGTMHIKFNHTDSASMYRRELDISKSLSKITYNVSGVTFTREYFISKPARVMMIKLTSSKKGALSFNVDFESLLKFEITNQGNTLRVKGYAPYHAEPVYRGNIANSVKFDENRGTRFSSLFRIKNTDGQVIIQHGSIGLKNGTEAILYIAIETSFNGFDKNPATEGKSDALLADSCLKKVVPVNYESVKHAHINDYQNYFNRVSFNLGKTNAPELPTDERLKRYAEGKEDKNLEILYFQFGRYLLISSSRTAGVPANLQGIWNPYIRPPWSSNYTTNINLQENYWLAENTNLSELHEPLMKFIGHVAHTGKVTAKTFYGVEGWALCHNSDIWAMSNPVGGFGQGDPVWANWNMGGTWLSTHLWEHYIFTLDKNFLKQKAYPLMKGAARFCLNWLVKDKKGNLITSPSTSPEASFITADGSKGSTLYGGTADLAMIRECFLQTIRASQILGTDITFRKEVESALRQLQPYQVGKNGNLQEWYYDWDDADPKHRHQSHLFGLFPGHHITPGLTPELANACKKTLQIKGDETTGWSKGWRINLWARLLDGNHAYQMYRTLLSYVDPDQYKGPDKKTGGGTYPNLLDAHPPFQIDGNFGGAAAVAEMLVQSNENQIRLLPALPDAWDTGKIKGICARGGFEIEMEWQNKSVKKYTITQKKEERHNWSITE